VQIGRNPADGKDRQNGKAKRQDDANRIRIMLDADHGFIEDRLNKFSKSRRRARGNQHEKNGNGKPPHIRGNVFANKGAQNAPCRVFHRGYPTQKKAFPQAF
jgi:hypothetical protein